MLRPTASTLRSFVDLWAHPSGYRLRNVSLDIVDDCTAVFRATLHGPAGLQVWARAWLGNDTDGTLGESASSTMNSGDNVILNVRLTRTKTPDHAYMRIESAPLMTEHVVKIALPPLAAQS